MPGPVLKNRLQANTTMTERAATTSEGI